MELIEKIKKNAQANPQRIVLPEGTEERTLKAADIALEQKLVKELVLLGNESKINEMAEQFGLKNICNAIIVDPVNNPKKEYYANMLYELRKSKGVDMDKAMKLVEDPLYLGVLMIKAGVVDGELAGADNATADVLRPALQIVKTRPGISTVSGAFMMVLPENKKNYGDDGIMVFADCAVSPELTAQQLAEIAVISAETAKNIACIQEPRVAILSFSTKGSAKHERVDKIIEATSIAKEMAPGLKLDGELQSDAAIVPSVAMKKAPHSEVAGKANVLIFPSLETGNIAYKLVQRLGDVEAVGPVLQGMAAPINDLSRGCSVDDIVNMIAVTVNQAAANK